MISLQLVALLLAVIFWGLATLKLPEPRFISWGWLGLFMFGLSLLWPHV